MPQIIEDDTDIDEAVDTTAEDDGNTSDPVDDGNTVDTPEQIAAANSERAKALKQVAGDEDEPEAKGPRIPKGRFDEVIVQRNTLTEQLAQANATIALLAASKTAPAAKQEEAEPEFDMKAAMKRRLSAVFEGRDEEALDLDEQIQAHTLKIATNSAIKAMQANQQEMTAAQESRLLAETAKDMRVKYPELDHEGPNADPDAIDFVVAKRNALMATGTPAHLALQKAVEIAVSRLGLGDPEPAPTRPDPAAARLLASRTRNAQAANQQAPDLGGRGERAVTSSRKTEELTEADIKAMPKAEFNRLAGNA